MKDYFTIEELEADTETPEMSEKATPDTGFSFDEVESVEKPYDSTKDPIRYSDGIFEIDDKWKSDQKAKGKVGFFESIERLDKSEMIPVWGGVEATYKAVDLYRAINRIKGNQYGKQNPLEQGMYDFLQSGVGGVAPGVMKKEDPDQKERDLGLIYKYLLSQEELHQRGGYSFMGGVATALGETLPFVGEFILTGGATAIGRGAAKGAFRYAVKQGVEEGMRYSLAKRGARALGGLATAGVRTAAMPQNITSGIMDRKIQTHFELTDKGIEMLEDAKMGWGTALLKATGDSFIQQWTEGLGPSLDRVGKSIGRKVFPEALQKSLEKVYKFLHPNEALRKLYTKTGFNGFINELGEEVIASLFSAITGVQDTGEDNSPSRMLDRTIEAFSDPMQWLQTATVIAIQGGIGQAFERTGDGIARVISDHEARRIVSKLKGEEMEIDGTEVELGSEEWTKRLQAGERWSMNENRFLDKEEKEKPDAEIIELNQEALQKMSPIPTPSTPAEVQEPTTPEAGVTPLEAEARKYKSAEEFVGSQQPFFHRTNKEFDISEIKPSEGGAVGPGIYLSKTETGSKAFGKNIHKVYIQGKLLRLKGVDDLLKGEEINKKAREEGYVGLDTGIGEIVLFDKSALKTKSQLTDIWNKANQTPPPNTPTETTEGQADEPNKPRSTFLQKKQAEPSDKELREASDYAINNEPPSIENLETDMEGGFVLPKETRWEAFRRKFEDFNIRLKTLERYIREKIGGPLSERLELWMRKDMLPRRVADAIRRCRDKKTEYVKNIVSDGLTDKEVTDYLVALHAEERNKKVNKKREENGLDPLNAPSGMTDTEAKSILKKATPEFKKKIEKYVKMYREYSDGILDFLVSEGMLKKEDAEKLKNNYKFHVRLYREMEDSELGLGTGEGVSIRGKEEKVAWGSEKRNLSAFGNLFYAMERAHTRALKNQLGNTIIDLVEEHPFLSSVFTVQKQRFIPRYDENGEMIYLDPIYVREGQNNVIGAKREGYQYTITIQDQRIADSLKNTNLARVNGLMRVLRTAITFLSLMKTGANLEFLITNVQRDTGEAMINIAKEKAELKEASKNIRRDVFWGTLKSWPRLWEYFRGENKDPVIDEFFKLGGDTGHFWGETAQKAEESIEKLEARIRNAGLKAKTWNAILASKDFIIDLNSIAELGIRFSFYEQLVQRGFSKEKAVQAAADLTVNFSRQGEWAPILKSFYAFINPAIQGTSKVIRTVANQGARKSIIKSMTALVGTGFAMGAISIIIGGDEDDKVSDYTKNHKLGVSLPNGQQWYPISLPYGYTTFYSIGRQMASVVFGKKTAEEGALSVLQTAIDSFSPFGSSLYDLVPTWAKWYTDIQQNKGWWGGNIHPGQIFTRTPKPNAEEYFESASEWSKFLSSFLQHISGGGDGYAGAIDISPNDFDYFASYWFGGATDVMILGIESLARGFQGEFDPSKTPFVRKFVREGSTRRFTNETIHGTLEKAWKQRLSSLEKERFYNALDLARVEEIYDEDKYNKATQEFVRAVYHMDGPILSSENLSKLRIMEDEDRNRLLRTYSDSMRKRIDRF